MADNRYIHFHYDSEPPRFRRLVISSVSVQEIAAFEDEDPIAAWKAMCAFIQDNPGHTYMSTSSFEQFTWDVPGYQFVEDEAGREVLVARGPETPAPAGR